MRENGFLSDERAEVTVAEVMQSRKIPSLITATPTERMTRVVELMRTYDISQIPVVDAQGGLIGIVTEVDLLDHLLHAQHVHDPEETIASIINPTVLSVEMGEKAERALAAFERGRVVAVTDQGRPVGILTKIDLIDFLARRAA